jgi:two-component system chemotaxis sensor kinase CheA
MLGKDIELDRTVLDEIHEPLVHLLRNAVDHGIETPVERKASSKPAQGIIRLSARREKNQVIIEVADDGKGMDPNRIIEKALAQGLISSEQARNFGSEEALNIIALPGFTTKVEATALSGRGVGVDVVRSKIESFGGTMRIQSEPGAGSAFILKIPITLAIIQALLFRLGQEIYSIPVLNTVETLEYDPSQLQKMKQGEMITYRESYMLLIRLGAVLEVPNSGGEAPSQTVLVVENNDRHFGLLVDEVIGQQEIAIKSLGPFLKQVRGFSGVTILGDGRICMVLDVPSLLG